MFVCYRSTDTSAPVLTGETGKLNDLLAAILVTGYGSKAAAGWTKPFNTTNAVCVFRNGTGSSQRYWRVRDDGPNVTSTFKEAWIRGYGTKADVNDTADASNTLQFPLAAQVTNGMVIRKSAAADATARVWTCYADARTCILLVQTGDAAGQAMIYYFGDAYDILSGSTGCPMIFCRANENSTVMTSDGLQSFSGTKGYLMQSYTGAGTALATTALPVVGSTFFGSGILPWPNGPDGGRHLSSMYVAEGTSGFATSQPYRARLRGIWYPLNGQSNYADGDTLSGQGATTGRTFNLHVVGGGRYALETSDTLESN